MSKHTLSKEIRKELEKLNDRIDRKIIKGLPFEKDARRHKELLATLRNVTSEPLVLRRTHRCVKSPVHKSLAGGAVRRLFGFGLIS